MARGAAERSDRLVSLTLACVAAVAVGWCYGGTLGFGFHYDDYHVLRLWPLSELRQVLTGTWDPTGVEVPFWRPVTAWWYAVRFQIFGLNAAPQHLLTLVGFTICGWMAGVYAWRETGIRRTGFVATVLYCLHPSLVYGQGVWLTNQMHLLASLVVLAALLVWQRVRSQPAIAWWPLIVLQLLAFGIKEDTVVLSALLVTLTVLRRSLCGDVPRPPWSVVAAAMVLTLAMPAIRYAMLGKLGGYGIPSADAAWYNFTRGLASVLRLTPARRPWQGVASVLSTAVLGAGIVAAAARRMPHSSFLLLAGLAITIVFDAPFVFKTKAEQYHLLGLGAAISLTGAIHLLGEIFAIAGASRIAAISAASLAVAFAPVTRHIADDYAPCSSATTGTDAYVVDWHMVPAEVRDWLKAKPGVCRSGALRPLVESLTTATWANAAERDEHGEMFQWTYDRSTVFVHRNVRQFVLSVRRPDATASDPATVTIRGPVSTLTLHVTDPAWKHQTVVVRPTVMSRLRRMHRVDIEVAPIFVPSKHDPNNRDPRRLGVQMRIGDVVMREE